MVFIFILSNAGVCYHQHCWVTSFSCWPLLRVNLMLCILFYFIYFTLLVQKFFLLLEYVLFLLSLFWNLLSWFACELGLHLFQYVVSLHHHYWQAHIFCRLVFSWYYNLYNIVWNLWLLNNSISVWLVSWLDLLYEFGVQLILFVGFSSLNMKWRCQVSISLGCFFVMVIGMLFQ